MIIFFKIEKNKLYKSKKIDCEVNLFLLFCVVVCLIIMNSFTYKYNSFYFKINDIYAFTDEIR